MEELFRFMLARPAQQTESEKNALLAQPSEAFYAALRTARASAEPMLALRKLAADYVASSDALHALTDLKYDVALQALYGALSSGADKNLNDLAFLIKKIFNIGPNEVVADVAFRRDRERLADTLIANAILGSEPWVPSDDAAKLLRVAAIVLRVAAGDLSLCVKHGIADALEKTIVLPGDIFPIPRPATASTPAPEAEPDRLAQLRTERERLFSTYALLTRVSPDQLAAPEVGEMSARAPRVAAAAADTSGPVVEAGVGGRIGGGSLVVQASFVAGLGEQARAVLQERQIDLTRLSLPVAVDRLSFDLQKVDLDLAALEGRSHKLLTKVGQTYLDTAALTPGVVALGNMMSVPSTHGTVAPAGIGDLLVVKQFLKRYEARELAHVENVLKGEFKEREHRRARTTEETITSETEEKREEEHDQQTTERFELKSESSQIQKEDTSLKIGLALSGKYGPVVEFKASTDFALNSSKEEASKIATSYSKDITTRATSRVSERRREERILKTIEVFEEKNTHGIDNKSGQGHVIGQYQWIDKIYEAQVFNYGKRLLFDIMLPEPAAFLLHATSSQPKAGVDLIKPQPFTLTPADLSEWNYVYYIQQYEVVGVSAPPKPYVTLSKAFEGKGNGDDDVTKAAEIPVPDGYQAVSAFVSAWYNRTSGGTIDVSLGTQMNRFSDNGAWNLTMNNEVGSIQFSMKTHHATELAVGVEVHCQRTQTALDDWKLKTHVAILQAFQKQLRDYEEKLAALEVQAAQQIQGRNPLENEQLIRTELKKGAISVFTAQHYDLFGAIAVSPEGYPQLDLPEADAEGKYIRFFEQAFEWEQMMYFFYPYFWGRKANWLKRALLQDVDPVFAEFIKAGSARIVVSVRPGFEKAVAHFLETAQVWDGGDLPDTTSPLYVSIIEEIRERDKAPGSEVAQGDPWDVRLPTTLILLRDKPGLPAWQKNAQGDWVPV